MGDARCGFTKKTGVACQNRNPVEAARNIRRPRMGLAMVKPQGS